MKRWTYEKAGVPHLKGDAFFDNKIKSIIRSTRVPGLMGSETGFAALFDFKKTGVKDPLLVASTDGVGTKLEVARLRGCHDTIGIDLVAMCVNDIITYGAQPVFFLDYFATGKFDFPTQVKVLKGIAAGCREAGCALVGGETAVMPGFYSSSQYDLAGFCVGLVDREKIVTGRGIKKGDALLGLASSGFHSNGFSLLRKVFSKKDLAGEIGKQLLAPTRIYVKPVLKLLKALPINGIANITGGGIGRNLPRVLPAGLGATIIEGSWPRPKLFDLVERSGKIAGPESMKETFNLGIGMIVVLKPRFLKKAQMILKQMKIASWPVGEITVGGGVRWTKRRR
ncbi:MAG TPA: phosphoribosylformylglycinamidine cyclo-ligase [bacterium]|nr:phosphoribosylformylglycinamidine cyclo-ligase [bacterium]